MDSFFWNQQEFTPFLELSPRAVVSFTEIKEIRPKYKAIYKKIANQIQTASYVFHPVEIHIKNGERMSLWNIIDAMALEIMEIKLAKGMRQAFSYRSSKHYGNYYSAISTLNMIESLKDYAFIFEGKINNIEKNLRFYILIKTIEPYIKDKMLLRMIYKYLTRTEFENNQAVHYTTHGLPTSPLTEPLVISALIPLDLQMYQNPNILYLRFTDSWFILTQDQKTLFQVVKQTQEILKSLHLDLDPQQLTIGPIQKNSFSNVH